VFLPTANSINIMDTVDQKPKGHFIRRYLISRINYDLLKQILGRIACDVNIEFEKFDVSNWIYIRITGSKTNVEKYKLEMSQVEYLFLL